MADKYVATTGNNAAAGTIGAPWKTIQYGVDNIAAGDTLWVRDGTYYEVVVIKYPGTSAKKKYLKAYAAETPVIDGRSGVVSVNSGLPGGKLLNDTPSYVTAVNHQGYKINQLAYTNNGLLDVMASHWHIEGIEAIRSMGRCLRVFTKNGADLTNIKFKDCRFHDARNQVAYILGAMKSNGVSTTNNITFDGCEFSWGQMEAPYLHETAVQNWGSGFTFAYVTDVLIKNCKVWGIWGEGLFVQGPGVKVWNGVTWRCERFTVQDSEFYDCAHGKVIFQAPKDSVIERCKVYTTPNNIYGTTSGIVIEGNEPQLEFDVGVESMICRNNISVGNSANIIIRAASRHNKNITIVNNTLVNATGSGVTTSGKGHPTLGAWGGTNIFKNNIVWNDNKNIPTVGAGPNIDSHWTCGHNVWSVVPTRPLWSVPATDLVANPLMANHTVKPVAGNVNANNYKLLNGSPAISKGSDAHAPDDDYFGSTRTTNTDIGAHEYGVSTATVTAAFSGSPLSGDFPLTVSFDSSSSAATNGIKSYYWSFGDGETSTAASPSHTYEAEGVYTVALTIAGKDGITDTEKKTGYITVTTPVIPPPTGGANVKIVAGRFAALQSTGEQIIEHSLGETPKAMLFFPTGAEVIGEVEQNSALGVGCVTAADARWAISAFTENNEATATDAQSLCLNDRVLAHIRSTAASVYTANFTSWDETELKIDWQEALPSAVKIPYIAFGGADLTAEAIVYDANYGANWATVGSTTTVTLGWQPDLVLAFGTNTAESSFAGNANISAGISVRGGEDNYIYYRSQTAQANGDPRMGHGQELIGFYGGTYAEIAYIATGFTITPRDTDLVGPLMLLALKMDNTAVWSNIINSPTTTGNADYTAPGMEAQFLMAFTTALQAENTDYTDANAGTFGVYLLDKDGNEFNSCISSEDAAPTSNENTITDVVLNVLADDGTTLHKATAGEFITDGWRWPMTTADGTARKWLALTIERIGNLQAGFTVSPIYGIEQETVYRITNLANANGLGELTYSYDWGDGSTPDTTAEPTHIYAESTDAPDFSGGYTIIQTVSVGELTAQHEVWVSVGNTPAVQSFTMTVGGVEVTEVPVGTTVLFTDTTVYDEGNWGIWFEWEIYTGTDVGGNKVTYATSDQESFSYTFTEEGSYNVYFKTTQSTWELIDYTMTIEDALTVVPEPISSYYADPIGDAEKDLLGNISGTTPLTVSLYEDSTDFGHEVSSRVFEVLDAEEKTIARISGVQKFYWTFLEAGTYGVRHTITTPAGESVTLDSGFITATPGVTSVIGPPVPASLSAVTQNVQRGDGLQTHEIEYTAEGDPTSIMGTNDQGGTELRWLAVNKPAQDQTMMIQNWRAIIGGKLGFAGNNAGIGSLDSDQVDIYDDLIPHENYAYSLGSAQKKFLEIHSASLFIETLVAAEVKADVGGRVIVGLTNTLTRPATTQFGGEIIRIKYNNGIFGDLLWFEGDGHFEMMKIRAKPVQEIGATDWRLLVEREVLGTAYEWPEGTAYINTGNWNGNGGQIKAAGFIDLYARQAIKTTGGGLTKTQGPTIVGNIRQGPDPMDIGEVWAIGDLEDLYGYTSTKWGVGLGQYRWGTGSYITIDSSWGMRSFSNGAQTFAIHPSKGIIFLSDDTGATNTKMRMSFGTTHPDLDNNYQEYSYIGGVAAAQTNQIHIGQNSLADRESGIYITSNGPTNKSSNVQLQAKQAGRTKVSIVLEAQAVGGAPYLQLNADADDTDGRTGYITIKNLPLSDPGVSDAVWRDGSGRLWISATT